MWTNLKIATRLLTRVNNLKSLKRTFLSEAYSCTDAWNRRLDSSLLSKINPEEIFYEIDKKFSSVGKASAVDVDIFANVVKNPDNVEFVLDVLHKLRLSPEATNILDSTHHAVIRYLFETNQIEDLITILHDRLNYGIFPDFLCYNMLMDAFAKKGDFANAAKVAVLLMLQEDSSNAISNALAPYCCYKYLEKPEDWPPPEPEPPEDPKAEVIKVRVAYIRNPYFDDHFDLKEPSELVGKTLVFYGKLMNDVLGRSCLLRGLVLWKKYNEAANLIKEWKESGTGECIYAEILDKIKERLSALPEENLTDNVKELKELIEDFDKKNTKEGNVIAELEKKVVEAVKQQEEIDIEEAGKMYKEWDKTRTTLLENQLAELDKIERLKKVDKLKEELHLKERVLTYFQNAKQIELKIEQKLKWEKEKYGKVRQFKEDLEDAYIPPEVEKKRSIK